MVFYIGISLLDEKVTTKMWYLPRGPQLEWFTVKITETQPNTFELTVIYPEKLHLSQFNDLMKRVQESIKSGDQVSVVRWGECLRIVTQDIDGAVVRLFSRNVRSKRKGLH